MQKQEVKLKLQPMHIRKSGERDRQKKNSIVRRREKDMSIEGGKECEGEKKKRG